MVYPVRKAPDGNVIHDGPGGQWNQEDKRKCSVAPKDGEEKWQDVSPEVHRKMPIKQLASASV